MVAVGRARVVVVDDHPLFRQGLLAALRLEQDFEVVGEAGSAAEALRLASELVLDLAVVDILMPTTSGISLTSELFELQPNYKVLGLSVIDDAGLVADMLRARACGFASKSQPVPEVIDALRQVLGGIRYLSPCVSRDAVEEELASSSAAHPLQRLTRREREVFELLIRGHSNDEVATRLFIARRTVETHRQRIMKKLSARSIVEMQRISARHGGLRP